MHPASETLWYTQLAILRPISLLQSTHPVLDSIFGDNILPIGCGLLIVAWLGCFLRHRFTVALLANFSAVVVGAIAHLWVRGTGSYETGSLAWIASEPRPDGILLAVLCLVSLTALVASHASFIQALRRSRTGPARVR